VTIDDITEEPYILYAVGTNDLGVGAPSANTERIYVAPLPPTLAPVPVQEEDSKPFYEELWFIILLIILLIIIIIALIICCCMNKKGGKYPGK